MSASLGTGPPTAILAAHVFSPESVVSMQQTKSSQPATGTTRGADTRVVSGDEAMQSTTDQQSFVHFNNPETVNVSYRFVSYGTISDHDMHTSQAAIPLPTSTLHVDVKKGDLPVVMLSDSIGYVTSPGFDAHQRYPNSYSGAFQLKVGLNESVLVNFVKYQFEAGRCRGDYLLYRVGYNIPNRICGLKTNIKAYVFRESLRISFHSDSSFGEMGFKMMFAKLPRTQEPQQLPSKLFNCSVPSFHGFSPVFNCNRLVECAGGEDELDCGFRNNDCGHRNNGCGMEDAIDTGTKCFCFVLHQRNMSWFDAHKDCILRGQKLAILEDPEEFRQFKAHIPLVANSQGFFVGAQLDVRLQAVSITALYRNIWQWVDGRTVFSVQIGDFYKNKGSCAQYDPWRQKLFSVSCTEKKRRSFYVCEFYKHSSNPDDLTHVELGSNGYADHTPWQVSIIQCPSGHVTRDFLSCDFHADCNASFSEASCRAQSVTVPMFLCQRSLSTVHYTLVCDHMQHCSDNSDEDFCKYPECAPIFLKCRNGQCIRNEFRCDGTSHCYDGSDEMCPPRRLTIIASSPPGWIYLDGKGDFWIFKMDVTEECPTAYFLCPGGFCLPTYLRCNGIVDCMYREDEAGCDTYKCRGFYRCRGSKVCLHADNVCDGVPQCPEQDDEMVCDLVCPDECRCQGLAFVCTSNFSATAHLAVRYLDASETSMTLKEVRDNILLIAIRLSRCHIVSLPLGMTFPNLRELDLSWNELHQLDMQRFHPLNNLRVLALTGNPLVKITTSKSPGPVEMTLERVDLSYTSLEEFRGDEFSSSHNVKELNISWSKLRSIAENGFQVMPRLETLDLRGSRLEHVRPNLLRHLSFLKVVRTENYKLCCEAMLPTYFDLKNCHTTFDLLASCEDLLKSNTYRIFLWIFSSLSLVGNVLSVGIRLYKQDGGGSGSFGVFIINLSVADFFMGVYLGIIGAADFVYRGRYLWRDDEWKNSAICNMAGFLCLLSSETSAFIICLITVDRFLVLWFPFGRLRFRRWSALVACGVVWAVGISLSTIPLLPMTSHWEFYSQTGICIPLPFTSSDVFRGYDYSFGVSILLNLVLFLVIAAGQVVVYCAVRANSMPSSTNTQTRDAAIARRLLTVVVSDFMCWFPIGLLGLLAATGTPIPGDLNVAVATFVLPVNSALNPFLYTFNLVMEKRRKVQMEMLLKRFEMEKLNQASGTKDRSGKAP